MMSKRDVVIFLAGAVAFHTISHLTLAFANLPMTFTIRTFSIELTKQLNMYAIIGSAVLTAVLLWWASKLK